MTHLRMSLGLLLVLCVLPLAASAGASRAIWTWEAESYAMVEDPAVADEAVLVLTAAEYGLRFTPALVMARTFR